MIEREDVARARIRMHAAAEDAGGTGRIVTLIIRIEATAVGS